MIGKILIINLRNVYLEFFGLTEPPFSIAPNPDYLFLSERHKEDQLILPMA